MALFLSCANGNHRPTSSYANGLVCCDVCGKVLHEDLYTDEPSFVKGAGGESKLSGSVVRSIQSGYSESFRRTLDKGRDMIESIVTTFNISGGDSIVNPACAFYQIAVERNFTRGRKTDQVAAACLYIACRVAKDPKPFLLIDFSEYLSINVYVLGAVFLQLCQLLSLGEHPTIIKPVDPSLYISRFTEKLLKQRNMKVSQTALYLIARMKRDWMQTGRKPSGLCGAALYISALSHGYSFSKTDIVKIVHICEMTLTKRLIEFENTDSGSLTIEELTKNAVELKESVPSVGVSQKSGEVLCEHKNSGAPHFAHGLCRTCYDAFVKLSGGLHGGSEPPAFQRAEKERVAMESTNKADESTVPQQESENIEQVEKVKSLTENSQKATENEQLNQRDFTESSQKENENEQLNQRENGNNSATGDQIEVDGVSDKFQKSKDASSITDDESDGLSDIDDIEVDGYLNNDEETRYKTIIWEEMNKEYLEEQAAAAAAKMEASQVDLENCSDELRAAHEFAAAAAAAVAKSRKERKRTQDSNANPAQTAAEAAHQMLIKKRLSSKINYDVLETLFTNDGKVTVRKSMMGTSQTTMMNRDKGLKTWSRKMTRAYIAMDCTMKMERILMTLTMIMVTMNIESKIDCVRRCSSRNALLNSLKPLGRNYKIRLEADIERKLKEKRNNIVEFIKERLHLDVIRIPKLVEQFFKIQFEFKAFFFYFLLFFPSLGTEVNVSEVVF